MKLLEQIIKQNLTSVAEFIFPRCCHLCESKLTDDENYICSTCLSRLPRTHYHRNPMNPMEQRFAGKFPFESATGHFFYARDSDLSILMQDLKYRHYRGLAKELGHLVGKELYLTSFLADIDCIIPIPIHFIKKAKRGYNQTEEIASGIEAATSIPIKTNLIASRPHKTQTSLTHQQRQTNTQGIFSVKEPQELSGLHILLLDDVCTTGATLTSAAETLLSSNPDIHLSLLTIGVTF